MESYAWHLSQELVKLGCSVTVLCESNENPIKDPALEVVCLPRASARPRWLALLKFSIRVADYVKQHHLSGFVIHSHERTSVHQVTTFHGPPFAHVKNKPIWKLLSFRVWAHLWLEKREVLGKQVRWVVPNSTVIRDELLTHYPQLASRLSVPIPPAVSTNIPSRSQREVDSTGGVIGFVGKEWKRKGLLKVLEIYKTLRQVRPNLKLLVVGVDQRVVHDLWGNSLGAIKAVGWKDAAPFYQDMDLLLHPANQEPFGMVVIEAMAARVPVVISSNCGAREYLSVDHGEVLALDSGVDSWVQACDRQLRRATAPPGFARGWDQVAREYLNIYASLTESDNIPDK